MSPKYAPNELWLEGVDGEDFQNMLISCVEDCHTHSISTMVIHLTSFMENVEVTDVGLERIKKIVEVAEQKEIKLAFENLTTLEHLDAVFEKFSSPYVGFCYDSGHENCFAQGRDFLTKYGNKLVALHLHDNDGTCDQHLFPFSGTVNWKHIMDQINKLNYHGPLGFEFDAQFIDISKEYTISEYLEKGINMARSLLNI